jgi:glucose-6-phosphate isomerase
MPQLLRFDPFAAFLPQTGVEQIDVASLGPVLEKLRDEICQIDVKMLAGEFPIPSSKQPLDAGFYLLPERLLSEYEADRSGSELARILAVTKRLMAEVDRVVVLGVEASSAGPRAVLDACCQPYFNELSRGERGSRPRIYFVDDHLDNDAAQGLLHLIGAHRAQAASRVEDSWGLVVVSKSGDALETSIAFRQYMSALETSCGGNRDKVRSRFVPVTGNHGRLREMAIELGCQDIFAVPDGVGERFSVLSAAGLVPAALMGVNVMQLLGGARMMNEHFRNAKAAENMILQYAAINHLMETKRAARVRLLNLWNHGLESAGKWYQQLAAASLSKAGRDATLLSHVATRDWHAFHPSFPVGRCDRMVNHVVVEQCRFDALPVGTRESDTDRLNDIADKTLPEIMAATIERTRQAMRHDGCPSTTMSMTVLDEHHLGQFFQWLMLATVVEARLLGVNPYRRTDVEAHEQDMRRLLTS